jgi:hypothetical protein
MGVELVGYMASLFVVLSLCMENVVYLRLLSLIGGLLFLTYGVFLGALPIILTNTIIIALNSWHLNKLRVGKKF